MTDIAPISIAQNIERVLVGGDLSALTPEQRVEYYNAVCRSIGLNPLTRPFEYITLNGKLVLYARRDCTDQLRTLRSVSINIVSREKLDDVFIVTARATTPEGRSDESTGVVALGSLKGDALANALMKAETKAKRRVTLSLCGLGWLDETEIETIPAASVVKDRATLLAEAAAFTTPNGTLYGTLTIEQLQVVIDKSKDIARVNAAELLIDELSAKA